MDRTCIIIVDPTTNCCLFTLNGFAMKSTDVLSCLNMVTTDQTALSLFEQKVHSKQPKHFFLSVPLRNHTFGAKSSNYRLVSVRLLAYSLTWLKWLSGERGAKDLVGDPAIVTALGGCFISTASTRRKYFLQLSNFCLDGGWGVGVVMCLRRCRWFVWPAMTSLIFPDECTFLWINHGGHLYQWSWGTLDQRLP